MTTEMTTDRLYLLDTEFADDSLPGRSFYCRESITVDALLAAFPDRAAKLDVVRVPFPRPRAEVVAAIGEENQELPALAFAEGGFTNEIEELLQALHTRHGFPERHP